LRLKLVLLAATAAAAAPALALAQAAAPQTPPPAKPAEAPVAVESVTVTGSTDGLRTSIDRRSYSVANDLGATTGSISDALRNVPSVEVDVQGNVSLRGDPNVTIMIDGKPSGMFNGDGRGDALLQMSAGSIDRVEVMTNPSAAYRPDGTGGVINLVTKKVQRPGKSATVRANIGADGRYNGGVSGSYRAGKLALSGEASLRHDAQEMDQESDRARLDPISGKFLESRQSSVSDSTGDGANLRAGIEYNLDAKTRVSGEVRRRSMKYESDSKELFAGKDAAGTVTRAYDRDSNSAFERTNTSVSADWRRQFKGTDHELVADIEYEVTDFGRDLTAFTDNRPGADTYEAARFGVEQTRTDLKVDYTRPLADQAKLKTGFELEGSSNDYDNYGARGPTAGALVVDPSLTNQFLYDQTVAAAYATYERPFGDFTAQAGLRLEQVDIETNQVTGGIKGGNDYFKAYPSLYLGYELNETQQLTASYSLRVQRPQAQDLNPFRVYQDPFNFRAGNPDLKPQETHSYEVGWQRRSGPTYYLVTAYYRESFKGVTDVVRDLGGGVLLTTRANLAESRNGGLEFVANGRLTPKITYNVSGNVYWNEIDAKSLGFAEPRSGTALGGRANVNWQATPKDFFQVNAFMIGKRLTPQGYREPSGMINLGYRRKVNDKLSLVVTAQDVAGTFKEEVVIDTPTLRDRSKRNMNIGAVFIGLTYTFGGAGPRQREPAFDFDAGAGPVG